MSNVLIGIIGVILFIGLALAGALFLGPRFQDASNSSRATALVAQAQQIAAANAAMEADTGVVTGSSRNNSGIAFLAGYLKTPPGTWNTYAYPAGTVAFTYLLVSDTTSKTCEAIQRQVGQIGPSDPPSLDLNPMNATMVMFPTGCTLHTAGRYAVYTTM